MFAVDTEAVNLLESFPSSLNAKMTSKTAERQRSILRMMEKSLERELDLEKRLAESKRKEEELHFKMNNARQEISNMEEIKDLISEKFLEAENVNTVLMGISRELMGRLQIVQLNLNSSLKREDEARLKLENIAEVETLLSGIIRLKAKLEEAEDKCSFADVHAVNLQDKINSLEGQLREYNSQLEITRASFEASQEWQKLSPSEIDVLESVIEDLRESVSKAESRAETVESKCKLLAETNLELNEEIGSLKTNSGNKIKLLEKQLRQSETQLQHAKASIEASKENQTMLFSALGDMENLIKDIKMNSSKAEARADNAESKCVLLTETNSELNDELVFLRGRVECLETSLHQSNNAKVAAAKDINVKVKAITDLLVQLATERERLQTQACTYFISSLSKQVKYREEKNDASAVVVNNQPSKVLNGVPMGPPSTNIQARLTACSLAGYNLVGKLAKDVPACTTEAQSALSMDESLEEVSNLEPVRSIEAGQLNSKHALMAFLILLISILAVKEAAHFDALDSKIEGSHSPTAVQDTTVAAIFHLTLPFKSVMDGGTAQHDLTDTVFVKDGTMVAYVSPSLELAVVEASAQGTSVAYGLTAI
ncbi:hypothetical protein ACLOJK_035242 [Asimina triloba]